MVLITPLIGAAVVLSGFVAAAPRPAPKDEYSSSNYNSNSYGDNSYGKSSDYSSSYNGGDSKDDKSKGSSDYSNDNSYNGGNSYDNSKNSYDNSNYNGGSDDSNYGGSKSKGDDSKNNGYDSSSKNNGYDSSSKNNGYDGGYDSSKDQGYDGNSGYDSSKDKGYDGNSNSYDGSDNYNGGGYNDDKSTSTSSYERTYEETSTYSSEDSYSTPSYGSGSNYWGGNEYQDCVNQCVAKFGGYSAGGSYQATATSGEDGSKGTGATHTVLVAPTKGVFRFVPFAVNASVGDVVEFHWGADQHTVTKSSALTPCNESNADPVFASGEQNKDFVFTQVVNDTQPTFYFCGTGTHCEQGMFGIINPAISAPGAPTSLTAMMNNLAATDSNLAAFAAYSSNVTTNNAAASSWGAQFDMDKIPAWAQGLFATNVLFTRATIGMNQEILQPDNSIDLSSVASTPLMIPQDLSGALDASSSASDASSGSSEPVQAAAGSSDSSTTADAPASTPTGGASALASPKMLVVAFSMVAAFLAL